MEKMEGSRGMEGEKKRERVGFAEMNDRRLLCCRRCWILSGVVVRGLNGVHSADAGSSSVRAMIRFSRTYSLRHCSAHRLCMEGWLNSTTSGRQ